MSRLLQWLRRVPPEERREKVSAERELVNKSKELDRKIERGQACAEKLKQTFERQISEGDGVSEMLRSLMQDMNHEDRAK